MKGKVLITGGAGFIGSHLADELLNRRYSVRVLDNLMPQVHGPDAKKPDYLDGEVEFIKGDVRDMQTVRRALDGVDAVFHFAAAVGVGQSMYEMDKYVDTNNFGTAVLLQALVDNRTRARIKRLVVASSMSIYGEGLYKRADGSFPRHVNRTLAQLKAGQWEPMDEEGLQLSPVPTVEDKPPALMSVYALSKYDQEKICLMIGDAYGIPTVALRFFNVYGSRQAISNPYTGVLAIFASRYMNHKPPLIYEDGLQQRDFVSVYDVVRASRLALEVPEAAGRVFNIGSGRAYRVVDIADQMAHVLGNGDLPAVITGKYRIGDIRHCFADISLATSCLGYQPRIDLAEGLEELSAWLESQISVDRVEEAAAELATRGLAIESGAAN